MLRSEPPPKKPEDTVNVNMIPKPIEIPVIPKIQNDYSHFSLSVSGRFRTDYFNKFFKDMHESGLKINFKSETKRKEDEHYMIYLSYWGRGGGRTIKEAFPNSLSDNAQKTANLYIFLCGDKDKEVLLNKKNCLKKETNDPILMVHWDPDYFPTTASAIREIKTFLDENQYEEVV